MYAVIHLPQFQLQAALRHEPGAVHEPAALLDDAPAGKAGNDRNKAPILQLNQSAREAGVQAGMSATQGQARCPEIRCLHRSATGETAARNALLQWAESISPRLEDTDDGLCTIDLAGTPWRLPEQQRALGERASRSLRKFNLHACIGIAANPDLARLAARFARPIRIVGSDPQALRDFLDPLPLGALEPTPEILSVLTGWGIRTLGELTALPRDRVTQRLGGDIVPLWQIALGGRSRPLRRHQPKLEIAEGADLEPGVERLDGLIFILNRFLQQIVERLGAVHLVTDELRLALSFDDGAVHQRTFRVPEPTRDTDRLLRILHTHLETLKAGAPVISVALEARPTRPASRQLSLFESTLRDPNRFAETLARLEALLGPERVGSPEPDATHRPDAFRMNPFHADTDSRPVQLDSHSHNENGCQLGLPLRRFRPPLPVEIALRDNAGDATLLRIASASVRGRIRRTQGPWRLSGDWWDRQTWKREEWDIELEQGGLYRLAREKGHWLLDGVYD